MTHKEFEDLTGITTTPENYAKIELIYMSASQHYDKQRFCEAIRDADKKTIDLLIDIAKTCTNHEQHIRYIDEQNRKEWEEQGMKDKQTAHTLLQKAEWFFEHGHDDDGWDCEEMAHNLIGRAGAIKLKVASDIKLTHDDQEYIEKHLK